MDTGAGSYRRYLNGDDTGLAEIVRDHKYGLTLYLCGIVGDAFTAEELMEDVFFKLVTKRPRFSGKSSFKTFLYAIGRNAALDRLRKDSRFAELSEQTLDERHAVERAYIEKERRRELYDAMDGLKPEYREALYLTYFEGLSNSEAGTVMHKSRRQMENLVYRAKKALGEKLGEEFYEE